MFVNQLRDATVKGIERQAKEQEDIIQRWFRMAKEKTMEAAQGCRRDFTFYPFITRCMYPQDFENISKAVAELLRNEGLTVDYSTVGRPMLKLSW